MDKSKKPNLSITAFCQACGAELAFDPSVVGKKARCLSCGHVFRVPAMGKKPSGSHSAAPSKEHAGHRGPSKETPPKVQSAKKKEASLDPLAELASSEKNVVEDELIGAPQDQPAQAAIQFEPTNFIAAPAIDHQATVTVLGVMQGLLYLAALAIGIILLHFMLGVVLTVWIFLPPAIVYGRKAGIRIVFLLIGRQVAADRGQSSLVNDPDSSSVGLSAAESSGGTGGGAGAS